jgi:hypothetical protein
MLSVTGRRSQVAGRRSQVAGRRSQVAGRRSQVAGHRSQVAGRRSQVTGHRSQVTGHRSQVTGHRSQVTGHRSQVTGHRSQVTVHKQADLVGRGGVVGTVVMPCFLPFLVVEGSTSQKEARQLYPCNSRNRNSTNLSEKPSFLPLRKFFFSLPSFVDSLFVVGFLSAPFH